MSSRQVKLNMLRFSRELVYFKTLVQQSTHKVASELANINVKTAKRYIADLEYALGSQLIVNNESSTTTVELTPLGQKLFAIILPKLEHLEVNLTNFDALRRKAVYRVLTFPLGYLYMTKRLLEKLCTQFTDITFELAVVTPTMISRFGTYIQDTFESFDLLLLYRKHLHLINQDKWIVRKIIAGKPALYTSRKYLDSLDFDIRKPQDLANLNYLGNPLETGQIVLYKEDKIETVQLKMICKLGIEFTILDLLNKGLGIAVVNETFLHTYHLEANQLVRIMEDWELKTDVDVMLVSRGGYQDIDRYILQHWEEDAKKGVSFI